MTLTEEQARDVAHCHDSVRRGVAGEKSKLVAALAVERDEAIALLKAYPFGDGAEPACDVAVFGDDDDACDGERNPEGKNIGGFCWEHRRRALLARLKGIA